MSRTRLEKVALLICVCAFDLAAAEKPQLPKFDKTRFEAYLRYAEGYTPNVKISIDDPTPAKFKDFSRIVVHASLGSQHFARVYYEMPDGRHFINGSVWDLDQSPYLDTIQHLPTGGPAFGPENAQVTIVIFSDFQCPYCRQLARTIRDNVPKKYPNEVRVMFEDYPLESIHPWALPMAQAAHCLSGSNPSSFWPFHDWVFEHQQEIKPENLRDKVLAYAREHELDVPKITACIEGHATAREVAENQEKAEVLQVQQTPTLFVNGRMLSGAIPWDSIDAVIKLELNRPKDIASAQNAGCCEVSRTAALPK